jgi:cell division protein FtsI (penicillin-binding protein 3)
VKFNDKSIKDSEHHGKNEVTFKEAFAISSNIGIASLANQVFNKNTDTRLEFLGFLKQFGLDRVTQIEIEGEPLPLIKNPVKDEKSWYGTTIPWMAHGYELLLTPLQILTFYNGVANGGKVVKPYLVSEIKGEDGNSKTFEPRILVDKLASTENILKAQELLKEVVLTGTAMNIKSDNFMIAGKTGTTRVNYANKEEYAKYNASFCGYFPAENPKYSMIVVLYNPQGVFYGSTVAAPIFKSIAEKTIAGQFDATKPINLAKDSVRAKQTLPEAKAGYAADFRGLFDYIGIPYKNKTNNEWAYVDPFEQKMLIENKKITKAKVPDVRGMGARDAVFVLENLGLGVSVQGSGRVTRMSITPGTPIRGQRIEIYLN